MLMTETQIKALIVLRSQACSGSCNKIHIEHVLGQIKALIFVLTGKLYHSGMVNDILDAIGVSYTKEDGDQILLSDEELEKIGIVCDANGHMSYKDDPKFGSW